MNLQLLILALLQALFVLLTAPLFSGMARVIRAKMHSRKGPPLMQNYYDLIKLMKRQEVIPAQSTWLFRAVPYLVMASALLIAMILPLWSLGSPLGPTGDLLLVIYLFASVRFFVALAGLDSGSSFAGIGVTREMALGILVEPSIMLVLFVMGMLAGSTQIGAISTAIGTGQVSWALPAVWLGMAAFAVVSYIELGKLPFDMAEAEQEVQEGALTEYSGRGLALMKWGLSMKQMMVAALFVTIFFPFGNAANPGVVQILVGLVLFAVKLVIVYLIAGVLENAMARTTILKTPKVTWVALGMALLAMVFSVVQG
jgi:hydrogenase-4 component C